MLRSILAKLNWSEASLRSVFTKLNWAEASLRSFFHQIKKLSVEFEKRLRVKNLLEQIGHERGLEEKEDQVKP